MLNTKYKEKKRERGASIIEILMAVAIIGILARVVFVNYAPSVQTQDLKRSKDDTLALFDEARSRTLRGEGDTTYGVHLQSTKAVLFVGTTYSAGTSTNKTVNMSSNIVISSISLNGGGSDVKFSRVSGATSQYGTFIIKKSSTTTGQKTITVKKMGLVSSN